MTCKNCGEPVKYARAVQTSKGPVVFCGLKRPCINAAVEREKYEATKRSVA